MNRYRIAGHPVAADIPNDIIPGKAFVPYAPFRIVPFYGEQELFSIRFSETIPALSASASPIARFTDDNGTMQFAALSDGGMEILLSPPHGNGCLRLHASSDFREARGSVTGSGSERRFAFDTSMMLLFAFASARCDTLLMHASAVELDGRGYVFLGKSGTGKSTHSRLWIENIPGSRLLNDDNPVIRIVDGSPMIYGSPWSGKTPCYVDRGLPLAGVVRLRQAMQNRIDRLSGAAAYAALFPSCSRMPWHREMAAGVHGTLSALTAAVPVFTLECLPDRDAALMCMETIVDAG